MKIIIYPFLCAYELLKNGYRQNRFEDEAYTLSKSIYKGGKFALEFKFMIAWIHGDRLDKNLQKVQGSLGRFEK